MDLIEAYYAVAEDLKRAGVDMIRTSDWLALVADRKSEQRMQEQQPSKSESEPATHD